MEDVPAFLRSRARGVARVCIWIVVLAGVVQLGDLFVPVDPWLGMGALYLSSAAMGLDAVVSGVRKWPNEGPSIRNLAPGGWAIFAAMFWLLAVPAYFAGARRRVYEEGPRVRVDAFSWVSIVFFALLGAACVVVSVVR